MNPPDRPTNAMAARSPRFSIATSDYHGTNIACLSAGGSGRNGTRNTARLPTASSACPIVFEYRKFEQNGAPEDNYGIWATADQKSRKSSLAEGPDTVAGSALNPLQAAGWRCYPTLPDGYWGTRAGKSAANMNFCCTYDEVRPVVSAYPRMVSAISTLASPVRIVTNGPKAVASGYAANRLPCDKPKEVFQSLFKETPAIR